MYNSMYICIYIYMLCIYIYVYVYICTYIHIDITIIVRVFIMHIRGILSVIWGNTIISTTDVSFVLQNETDMKLKSTLLC